MKYLIIGNGVAGVNGALAIRKKDPEGDIFLISESKYLHYYRPKLIDYLASKTTKDKITIYKEDFYQAKRITNVLGSKIVSLDPVKKVITDTVGKEFSFDKLLLATGSHSFLPPFKGLESKGVFALRGFTDCDLILSYLKDVKSIAIIGGGLLGLETAQSLNQLGKKITIIEFAGSLLPRQLDPEGGARLQKFLEAKGLNFLTDQKVSQINQAESGKVKSITLESGKELQVGAVVISAGVRPNLALAQESGLEIEKGIVVNDYLETSHPDIYAAGDVSEHRGRLYGLWANAQEQGKIAGLNMTGQKVEYFPKPPSTALKVTGIDLYSAGDVNDQEAESLVVEDDNSYQKLLIKDNKPIGAIVLGNKDRISLVQKIMSGSAEIKEFKK